MKRYELHYHLSEHEIKAVKWLVNPTMKEFWEIKLGSDIQYIIDELDRDCVVDVFVYNSGLKDASEILCDEITGIPVEFHIKEVRE